MDFIRANLLSLIVFVPVLGALVLLLLPARNRSLIRWTALLFSLIPLGLSFILWNDFHANPCYDLVERACFEQQVPWFPLLNSSYHVGVDGISLTLVLLTTILTPLAILMSWTISDRVKMYMALFLLLEMGMVGVFVALDLLIFFVFWEFGLVPMYFLINQWGSANRQYASFKFFIYTMAGSLGLLLSIQLIGLLMHTFDIPELMRSWPAFAGEGGNVLGFIPVSLVKNVAFWAFTLAFAIKVPVWPFHTWLPDAHTEAPTAGSMILAGVLLKLGAYGFVRFVLPLFPGPAHNFAPVLAVLAMLAIVMGAFASFAQTDFKRLVAYSSVNHMGFVVLGVAAAAWIGLDGQYNATQRLDGIIALNGAVLQMFAHGLSAAGMFALVGMLYERLHTRDLMQMGGLWVAAPLYGGILLFMSMGSLGLPGLAGFVAEFMVVRGVWPVGAAGQATTPIFQIMTAISMLGLLFTGAYILKAVRHVLHGPLNQQAVELAHGRPLEITMREVIAMAPLLVLMLLVGIFPAWLVTAINETVTRLLTQS